MYPLRRRISYPGKINARSPEAAGLKFCAVARPGGMIDLVSGKWGTRSGSADPGRLSECGVFDSKCSRDGFGYYEFDSTAFLVSGNPFTVVSESICDSITGTIWPSVAQLRTSDNGVIAYAAFSDSSSPCVIDMFGHNGWSSPGTNGALSYGLTGLERVWVVWSYDGGNVNSVSSYNIFVNGIKQSITATGWTGGSGSNNIVGASTDGGYSQFNGGIRQLRIYDWNWGEFEAIRVWHPITRDNLFCEIYEDDITGQVIAAAYQSRMWHVFH